MPNEPDKTERPTRAGAREDGAEAVELVADQSAARRRLIEEMCKPESTRLNIADICEQAEVSRDTYYKAVGDPEFRAARLAAVGAVIGDLTPAIQSLVRSASVDGPDGALDRVTLFKLLDLFPDKKLNVKAEIPVNAPPPFTPAQVVYLCLKYKLKREDWPPMLVDAYEHGNLKPEPCQLFEVNKNYS